MNAQQQYEIEASAALADAQADRISFAEWNVRQRSVCQKYYEAQEKEGAIASEIVPNRIKESFKWEFPLPFPRANNAKRQG